MPAYVHEYGKGRFFKHASKFGARYATLGFNDVAKLDDGDLADGVRGHQRASTSVTSKLEKLLKKAVGT